ncbi:MAG: hypothetical protein NTW50_03085 [Candidatus Berkelbacteria bacterium]|nr:hypothetical protein [Candidatus Berkelbacteria bacterium]
MANEKDLHTIKKLLDVAENNIRLARNILFSSELAEKAAVLTEGEEGDKAIEGIFDGEFMIGPSEKRYPVQANYASKSKLLPGDVLKLTITAEGAFLYKQIGPVKRKKMVGTLRQAGEGYFVVETDKEQYRISSASASYFKAKIGDKLTILVPDGLPSEWAAVENLLEEI